MERLVLLTLCVLCAAATTCERVHPAVIFPGIFGTVTEGEATGIPANVSMPVYCARKFGWKRLWIAAPVELLYKCFEYYWGMNWDGEQWQEPLGMNYGIPGWGTTYPVDTLDPSFTWKSFSHYFHNIIKALVAVGYAENKTILSAPYDWRKLPDKEWADKVRELIEKAVASAGTPAVLIAHSMGAPRAYYFLMSQTAEWRAQYIHRFIALSPAWMGAGKSFDSLWEGLNFGLPIDGSFFAPLTRRIPSVWYLLPEADAFPSDHVLLQTPSRNWTTRELPELFDAIGIPDALKKIALARSSMAPWGNNYNQAPGVPVSCIYASGHATTRMLITKADVSKLGPDAKWPSATRVTGDGDGTVNIESLLYAPTKWKAMGNEVEFKSYPNLAHVSIITHKEPIEYVVQLACKI